MENSTYTDEIFNAYKFKHDKQQTADFLTIERVELAKAYLCLNPIQDKFLYDLALGRLHKKFGTERVKNLRKAMYRFYNYHRLGNFAERNFRDYVQPKWLEWNPAGTFYLELFIADGKLHHFISMRNDGFTTHGFMIDLQQEEIGYSNLIINEENGKLVSKLWFSWRSGAISKMDLRLIKSMLLAYVEKHKLGYKKERD